MFIKLNPILFILLVFNHYIYAKADRWDENITYNQIIERAKNGSPYYQGLLGIYLRSGEAGSSVNVDLSRKWSEVAASAGHPFGAYNLANLAMLDGDLVSATTLYQDAALRLQRFASDGDPVAMYCMGEIDFQVIPTNVNKALSLFVRSAELGYPQAQATIGALYLRGLPGLMERNTEKGIKLLSKAVRAKSLTARFNLGMAYYNGDGVEKNRIEGLALLQLAAKQNHQLAKEYLHKSGNSMDQQNHQPNIHSKFKSNQKRVSYDDKDRMDKARRLYTGVGVEQNYDKAFELFIPLAQGGNAEAARFVGLMKLSGKGTKKDLNLAKEWLSVASQKGDKTARRLLDSYKSLF
jgi:TPR repeat protein